MIYLDTSFVAPYYLNEASSAAVTKALHGAAPGQLALSSWTCTEFSSVLARLVRMSHLTRAHALDVMDAFEQDLQSAFFVIHPVGQDFAFASALCLKDPALGLRSADALHVAVAANRNLPIYTLDKTLIRAAIGLGYSASDAGVGE